MSSRQMDCLRLCAKVSVQVYKCTSVQVCFMASVDVDLYCSVEMSLNQNVREGGRERHTES